LPALPRARVATLQAKKAFVENRNLSEERDILAAVNRGRYAVKEMVAVAQVTPC
jgi:hypothetical protein